MERKLAVYLHRRRVGTLIQDKHGDVVFAYDEDWLSDPAARPLSQSLPLAKKSFDERECRPFFAGILPEESRRKVVARNLGISEKNDFAMLEQIGGECAGAVTFLPAGATLPVHEDAYKELNQSQLASLLRSLPKRPLLAGEAEIRLSLAGAQDKIAVRLEGGSICLPLNGSPSTHILKPQIARFEGVVTNEELCMKLAAAVGIPTATAMIGRAEDVHYIMVERYDRTHLPAVGTGKLQLHREHQEDFCQALGIVSEHKYQVEGGPSLKQCFELVRSSSSVPVVDLQSLLNAVFFNFLIGNNDAHGKNFSMIYRMDGQTRLAPLYDLVSTAAYPELSARMAMRIGGEYHPKKVGPKQIENFAKEAALSFPLVRGRVLELADAMIKKLPAVTSDEPFAVRLAGEIKARCENAMKRYRK